MMTWIAQGSQSRTGGCTGLASGMIYFSTGQYRCTVSGLPLFYIYIYIVNVLRLQYFLNTFTTNHMWLFSSGFNLNLPLK